jgi:hypothetical protein
MSNKYFYNLLGLLMKKIIEGRAYVRVCILEWIIFI